MSGEGVISVRFQRRLLDAFCFVAQSSRRTLPGAARFLIQGMKGLTSSQLSALNDPPPELDNTRVSLYVGRDCIALLTEASQKTGLSVSSILRRLAFGLIDKSIWFVQDDGDKNWRLATVQNNSEDQHNGRGEEEPNEASRQHSADAE